MNWEDSKIRKVIVEARSANNFALIRRVAQAWATTKPGVHLGWLLDELDGGPRVTDARMLEICMLGYFHTIHGDALGDDIWTLVEAIRAKRKAAGEV